MHLFVVVGLLDAVGCIQLLSYQTIRFLERTLRGRGICTGMGMVNLGTIHQVDGQPGLAAIHQKERGVPGTGMGMVNLGTIHQVNRQPGLAAIHQKERGVPGTGMNAGIICHAHFQ